MASVMNGQIGANSRSMDLRHSWSVNIADSRSSSVKPAPYALPFAALHNVTQKVPREISDFVRWNEEVIVRIPHYAFLGEVCEFSENPLVARGEDARCLVWNLETCDEPRNVPELREKLPRRGNFLLGACVVRAHRNLGCGPEPEILAAILLKHEDRVYHVSLALAHSLSFFIKAPTGDPDITPGYFSCNLPASENAVVEPRSDDVLPLRSDRSRIGLLVKRMILPKLRNIERADTRVHPGVKRALISNKLSRSTPRAFGVSGRRVLPWLIIWPGLRKQRGRALLAIPDRHLGSIEPPPGNWPVKCNVDPVQEYLSVHLWMEVKFLACNFAKSFLDFDDPHVILLQRNDLNWCLAALAGGSPVCNLLDLVQVP